MRIFSGRGVLLGAALWLCTAGAVNYSVLISTSFLYHNYRHNSNVVALKRLLMDNGYEGRHICAFTRDDVTGDSRNPYKEEGLLCVGDYLLRRGRDFAVERRSSTYWDVLALLSGKDAKLLGLDESSNLLIYITGHGGEGFIKFCNRSYFYRDDLTNCILKIQEARRVNKILVIVDTCQADTLLDHRRLAGQNISVITTSEQGRSSMSLESNDDFGVFPIDMFVKRLYDLHRQGVSSVGGAAAEAELGEMLGKYFTEDVIKSKVSIHGDRSSLYRDFFFQRPASPPGAPPAKLSVNC